MVVLLPRRTGTDAARSRSILYSNEKIIANTCLAVCRILAGLAIAYVTHYALAIDSVRGRSWARRVAK